MDTRALAAQASNLITNRQPREAIKLLWQVASDLSCTDPFVHTVYANALMRTGASWKAAAHLKPLLATLLAGNPVAITTAAVASINANHPDEALEFLSQISREERRGNHLFTYVEAKAHFAAGRMGTTIELMRGVISKHSDDAFAILFLACHEDSDQHVGVYKMALGQSFARIWDKSRLLQQSIHVIADEERNLFRSNHRLWELGAKPINKQALRELGIMPHGVREAVQSNCG